MAIILADALIKKVSQQSFLNILRDPWMIAVYGLYIIQIGFAIFIFMLKGELSIYTNLFIVFYGVFGVLIGITYFKETLSIIQIMGICFGLFGAILMTKGN